MANSVLLSVPVPPRLISQVRDTEPFPCTKEQCLSTSALMTGGSPSLFLRHDLQFSFNGCIDTHPSTLITGSHLSITCKGGDNLVK
jgi:hypothetical protein